MITQALSSAATYTAQHSQAPVASREQADAANFPASVLNNGSRSQQSVTIPSTRSAARVEGDSIASLDIRERDVKVSAIDQHSSYVVHPQPHSKSSSLGKDPEVVRVKPSALCIEDVDALATTEVESQIGENVEEASQASTRQRHSAASSWDQSGPWTYGMARSDSADMQATDRETRKVNHFVTPNELKTKFRLKRGTDHA